MMKRRDLLATGVAGGSALVLGTGAGLGEAQAQVVPPASALDEA